MLLAVWGGLERELLTGGPVLVLASLGLVAGLWLCWLLLTVVAVGDIVLALVRWPAWSAVLVNGVMLALLLAGPTRRYAQRGRLRIRRR